jgi:hypothetical protein
MMASYIFTAESTHIDEQNHVQGVPVQIGTCLFKFIKYLNE